MASAVNPAVPSAGQPTTQSVRDNFQTMKDEIEALQGEVGGALPAGIIVGWSGSIGTIPEGWALCDGANGTLDLRDNFVRAATNAGDHLATGGNSTLALTQVTMANHTHTLNSTGAHTHPVTLNGAGSHSHTVSMTDPGDHDHTFTRQSGSPDGGSGLGSAQPGSTSPLSSAAGGHSHTVTATTSGLHSHSATSGSGGSHGHTIESTGSGTPFDNRPQYYALFFIQKV